MSSIADALRRAEQERERMRQDEAGAAGNASPHRGGSLADVVLRKAPPEKAPAVAPPVPATVTPVADAVKRAPTEETPAVKAQQQATETIVEDYASKRKLNLPSSLVAYHDRSGATAAQYRRIRDKLMLMNAKREPQVIVVTSSLPGEGKTTTVLNLGLSLVEIRANRVLLIDGCMEEEHASRPSLTSLLKMQSERGLAELLSMPPDSPQTLPEESFTKATPWHRLFVLPSGAKTGAAAATALLKSTMLRTALRQMRANFDWVLVDAPAAMDMPDAGLLGGASDGMVVTVAMHRTPQSKAQKTVRRLKSMNLPVRMCLLTRA